MDKVRSWLVVGFLALITVFLGYLAITQFSGNKECSDTVLLTKVKMIEQQKIFEPLMSNYIASAYEDTSIERIAEQQLIAEESQITALQVITTQNNLIYELLSACK